MLYLGLTRSKLETEKSFFETHLNTLNNIKIDSAGKIDEIAKKKLFQEVSDVSPSYLAFTELGMSVYSKSYNYPWKLWTYIPTLNPVTKAPEILTYREIGEATAYKDPKLLLNQLQDGYSDRLLQITLAMDKIRYDEIFAIITTLDTKIRKDQWAGRKASQSDIDEMQRLVNETNSLEVRLKKAKLI
ncbi:MAG: hypothetical protein K940chlam1_00751 [Candidatus Anoxychlamydiales bacterium]|nr:hypothetical protein [Candidatus Anoxychlamydiales bacterium]NGX35385.1 hypothetical protein [Candidatus Anoxychlamydiales bacterium]